LKKELEIRKEELLEQWHFSSLEKIFIGKRIYRRIEECETWEAVIETIDKGLKPYKKLFHREITEDDIIRLTEIKIKRISKYNSFKADEIIKGIELEIDEVNNHLEHLIDYAINYFRQIKKKYRSGKERKTEIRNFDTIEATRVAAATQKLYVNREDGFAGTSLRKDEFVCVCSDIDDIIVFRADGAFIVTKVASKTFVGKDILHIDVYKKNDDRTIYNLIFRDGRRGPTRVKRFAATSVMRDKEYNVTKGTEGSKILYFTCNPNGEAEVVKIFLKLKPKLKKLSFEFDFSDLAIKGKGSQGNILTKHGVKSIVKREEGVSTLGARDIWYDDTVKRLNTDERGTYLGAFKSDEKLLTIQKSGYYKKMNYDLSNHFAEDMLLIEKFNPKKIISVIYFESSNEMFYLKRFQAETENNINRQIEFIGDNPENYMVSFSIDWLPQVKVIFNAEANKKEIPDLIINVEEFIGIKSPKAKGKRITAKATKHIKFIEPLPYEEPEDEVAAEKDNEDIQIEENDHLSEVGLKPETDTEPKNEEQKVEQKEKPKSKPGKQDDAASQMELF
jgi:topoisomerase-4 subunit A